MFVLLAGCGGLQVDTEILSPSFATATAIEQTRQAIPTSQSTEVRLQTATHTPKITTTLPTVTPSPTVSVSDFVSWDRLIDYDLLKDIDWTVFTANVYTSPSGLRRYALAMPSAWNVSPENPGNELVLTNYDTQENNTVKFERVIFVFRCVLNEVITTFEGEQQKVRIAGEPGMLWTNVVEPDRHHEFTLFFEHDGANYTIFGSIDLPSTDSAAMEKFQAMLFYAMSSLIVD